jgi:hypothetical protein
MPNISKWILVAAARPNFMKIAPLMRAIEGFNNSPNPSRLIPHAAPPPRPHRAAL